MRYCRLFIICVLISFFSCDGAYKEAGEYIKNGDLKFPELVSFSIYVGLDEYKCFINQENKTVSQAIPYGIDRSNLSVYMESTEKARYFLDNVEVYNGDFLDMSAPFTMRLKDPGGEYTDYEISITNAANEEALIYSLSLGIDGKNYVPQIKTDTVIAYLPYATPLDMVSFSYVLSDYARFTIDNYTIKETDAIDLRADKIIKIIAASGRERNYTLIVKYEKNTRAELSSFQLNTTNEIYNCPITGAEMKTDVAYGTNLTNIIPKFNISYGAKLYDANGTEIISGETAVTFKKGEAMFFNVVSEDGVFTNGYSLLISELPNHEAKIIQYSAHVGGATYPGTIEASTITVSSLPIGTNLNAITDSYILSPGAYVYETRSPIRDDNNTSYVITKFYRVISQDAKDERNYIININVSKNNESKFESFLVKYNAGGSYSGFRCDYVNSANPVIDVLCITPFKGDKTDGIAEFTVSTGATVYIGTEVQQSNGTARDFSGLVEYRVVSETLHETVYRVTTRYGCYGETTGANTVMSTVNPTQIENSKHVLLPTQYGIGSFRTSDKALIDSCGYELYYPQPAPYNIVFNPFADPYPSGGLAAGTAFRIVANSQGNRNNIRSSYYNAGQGFTVITKNLDSLQLPPIDQVYLDPATGKFTMPGTIISMVYPSNPGIVSPLGLESIENSGQTTHGVHYPENTFRVDVDPNVGTGIYSKKLYPSGAGYMSLPKGAAFFRGHYGIGALQNGFVSIKFHLRHNLQTHSITQKVWCDPSSGCRSEIKATRSLYSSCSNYGTCTDMNYSFDYRSVIRFYLYIVWDFETRFGGTAYAMKIYKVTELNEWELIGLIPYDNESLSDFNTNAFVLLEVLAQNVQSTSAVFGAVPIFKFWDNVVSENPVWLTQIEERFLKDIVHPIYGAENAYNPGNIEVSFFSNE